MKHWHEQEPSSLSPSSSEFPELCPCDSPLNNRFIKDSVCGRNPLTNAFYLVIIAFCVLSSAVGVWAAVKYC